MQNKAPVRTCIACGKTSEKRELLRIVRTPEGDVCVDVSGKAAGRGAYVCLDATCFAQVRKKRSLDGRLRTKLSPDKYEDLQKEFDHLCASNA